ncbi:hypothetical protein VFPFJ_09812 [Purpureocillium lilacinum]|uniref:Uncharacterized protein n=1 Tax=Purpureocillium lilacinum TaxID=33203 RepID=A0A179GN44_PURLI|nr:hypothetical protein VFPFJ_09812 [Purpureocillium lilacinum]OAQ79326.1 hypothetical protein VFPFJ_09812 [Purpureocillium lilacinum]
MPRLELFLASIARGLFECGSWVSLGNAVCMLALCRVWCMYSYVCQKTHARRSDSMWPETRPDKPDGRRHRDLIDRGSGGQPQGQGSRSPSKQPGWCWWPLDRVRPNALAHAALRQRGIGAWGGRALKKGAANLLASLLLLLSLSSVRGLGVVVVSFWRRHACSQPVVDCAEVLQSVRRALYSQPRGRPPPVPGHPCAGQMTGLPWLLHRMPLHQAAGRPAPGGTVECVMVRGTKPGTVVHCALRRAGR